MRRTGEFGQCHDRIILLSPENERVHGTVYATTDEANRMPSATSKDAATAAGAFPYWISRENQQMRCTTSAWQLL
jgi:hypothetical protein